MRKIVACLAVIGAMVLANNARGGAPLPSLTFYGMLVDEFGWPYESNVRIDLYAEGLQVFSKSIAPARGRDYNFLFRLPYDSGNGDSYTSDAISPGDHVSLKIVALATGSVLINTNFVVALPPGAVFNINLSAGTDSVGDGIPDELRRWIWQNLGLPGAFDPKNIRAQDDSDGDGVSNLNEYRAGTDPANADDVLRLEVSPSGVPGIGKLTFYTVPGKTYEIQSEDFLADEAIWSVAHFANDPASAPSYTDFIGTGHFVSLFVPWNHANTFYRVFTLSGKASHIVP